ncbi:hypothetical protein BGI27_17615 [Candidatus Dactylopiibacterium carminicum]|uniref:Secreted protein n=1 Tax=Candidatus Dactylopiibacterium carminicum TaxID=857335 RepID=A0ABQ7HKK1_9RHOO|nr:hypothetical protein BGI27_17615 [Candidatus Dactylopiibacterium carminicum]PAS93414.1 MAG: hypothetical protein BSR46_17665 [Candidatus Dactylopiibacterium carminicum]
MCLVMPAFGAIQVPMFSTCCIAMRAVGACNRFDRVRRGDDSWGFGRRRFGQILPIGGKRRPRKIAGRPQQTSERLLIFTANGQPIIGGCLTKHQQLRLQFHTHTESRKIG